MESSGTVCPQKSVIVARDLRAARPCVGWQCWQRRTQCGEVGQSWLVRRRRGGCRRGLPRSGRDRAWCGRRCMRRLGWRQRVDGAAAGADLHEGKDVSRRSLQAEAGLQFRGDARVAHALRAALANEFEVREQFRLERFARHRGVRSDSSLFSQFGRMPVNERQTLNEVWTRCRAAARFPNARNGVRDIASLVITVGYCWCFGCFEWFVGGRNFVGGGIVAGWEFGFWIGSVSLVLVRGLSSVVWAGCWREGLNRDG